MSLKHGLLGLLSLKPYTGYDLNREFAQSLKYIWQTKTTQIYVELKNMEQRGWLVSEQVIQNDKPNKRVYTITEEGSAEFLNWLAMPDEDVKDALTARNAFLLRVLFAGNTSKEQAIKLLESFREVCVARSTAHKGIRDVIANDEAEEMPPQHICYYNLVARHGEMMNKTRLEWIEEAIQTIKEAH
ncbi:MAG: PadR family transcriptional regulator [Defluviitaleaceae bacterium]|nr:PadR family transcriptional regulator [Defluviitaleaceae bacterium]MCL2238522.1 PadR family transcriptional regulator [Defluviitaleaceae bacterium]